MDYRHIFDEEIKSSDEASQRLNLEASENGYKFYKGPTNKKTGYCYFYCKYKFKNAELQIGNKSPQEGEKQDKN